MTSPQGRLWHIDSAGLIHNDASLESIQSPFDLAVTSGIDAYIEHLANDIHSIYVTGSVARGRAVENISDLNIFAVLAESLDPELVLQDWVVTAEESILSKHRFITDVQLELWPHSYVFTDPAQFSIGAFIIKTQSVCVWGNDLAPELPDYKISAAIANDDIVQIALDIEEAVDAINDNPRSIRYECQQIMRQILRTGFALVLLEEGVYTRDPDLCYHYFSKQYPDRADDMRRALEYAERPSGNPVEVLAFLDDFGGWIADEADQWLDRYNPECKMALGTDEVEEE